MSTRSDVDDDSREGFLKRWSSRKLATTPDTIDEPREVGESEPHPEEKIPLNTIVPEGTPGRMRTMVEADRLKESQEQKEGELSVKTDVDMPPLESLDESSDYSGFMSPGVSEALRKRALRKLFTAAVFNVRDGLDDYDDDFTSFEPLGDMVTSDMKHQAEVKERRRQEEEARQAAAEGADETDEAPVEEVETAHGEQGLPEKDDPESEDRDEREVGQPDQPDGQVLT